MSMQQQRGAWRCAGHAVTNGLQLEVLEGNEGLRLRLPAENIAQQAQAGRGIAQRMQEQVDQYHRRGNGRQGGSRRRRILP